MSESIKQALIDGKHTSPDGTYVQIGMDALMSIVGAPSSKQAAWPKEEIGLGQFADVDPAVLGPAMVIDIEEKYLLGHFDANNACDIMLGDVQGSFHRIREALAGGQQSAASTAEPVAYRWVLPGEHTWNVTIYHPRHYTTETPSKVDPLGVIATATSPEPDAVREALRAIYEWYDRDGSVGAAADVFEDHRDAVTAALSRPADPRNQGQGGGPQS